LSDNLKSGSFPVLTGKGDWHKAESIIFPLIWQQHITWEILAGQSLYYGTSQYQKFLKNSDLKASIIWTISNHSMVDYCHQTSFILTPSSLQWTLKTAWFMNHLNTSRLVPLQFTKNILCYILLYAKN